MTVFNIRHVLLILAGFFLLACQFNLTNDIVNTEKSIISMGVNISRLTSIDEIPVDNISYVNRGLIEAVPVKGTLIKITDQRYYDFLGLLKSELVKYPDNILRTDVDNIFVAGQILSDEDKYTAGFYYPGTQNIYLFPFVFDMPSFEDGTTIRSTIHHEISSILLRKYRFDMIGFMAYNGFEIEYWNDEDYLLANPPPSYYASDALLTEGLLTHYAQTSPENDYNGYVEVAFSYPEIMSRFCSSYERIKLKYEFIKKFYLKISADFQPVFDQVRCDNAVNSGV
jgi:hypothetical protein